MVHRSSFAFTLSIIVHVGILLLLSSYHVAIDVPERKVPHPIKSYLYQKPKPLPKIVQDEKVATVEEKTQPSEPSKEAQPKQTETKINNKDQPRKLKQILEKENKLEVQTSTNPSDSKLDNEPLSPKSVDSPAEPLPTKSRFSVNQLRNLRERINSQHFQQIERERAQPNTGSVLHGTPELVPHSVAKESADEKRKKATSNVGPSKQIIKGDDGNCTLVEDLSVVGIEGVTAVSSFGCGETKFDRNFREHMQKVMKKLGKDN